MGGNLSIERAALGMAQEHGKVTAAQLVDEHGIDDAEAKRVLALLHERRELELDLEGEDFVYRLRGTARAAPPAAKPAAKPAREAAPPKPEAEPQAEPTPEPKAKPKSSSRSKSDDDGEGAGQALMRRGKEALTEVALDAMVDRGKKEDAGGDDKKSLLWGVGLGFFVPGAGLFYAAPWITAVFATVVVAAVVGILQLIPLLGGLLTYIVLAAFMVTSGALGGLYTYKFNRTGKRTRLLKEGGPKALPL